MKTAEEVAAFQASWVEALKSGRFIQAESTLKGDGTRNHDGTDWFPAGGEVEDFDAPVGYCCLGVGLEIDPAASIEYDYDPDNPDMPSPLWLATWGIEQADADVLASYNDGSGKDRAGEQIDHQWSFDEIADHIATLTFVPYEVA